MKTSEQYPLAPELEMSAWINTPKALTLAGLKGKVVVVHAFQMLCPGCVSHGLPQATAIHEMFADDEVQVIGLHTVFEHHGVMTVEALQAFVSEYRLAFPIAVDLPSTLGTIPSTMKKYSMQGTPTLIIIDQQGCIRLHHFGSFWLPKLYIRMLNGNQSIQLKYIKNNNLFYFKMVGFHSKNQ